MNTEFLNVFFNREKVAGPDTEVTKTFAARCHCGNVQFTVTLPAASLPLNGYICSCTMCRYTHGTLGSFHTALPQGVAPEWTNGNINLAIYKTQGSGRGGHGQRWFCPTCGAHNGHYEPWAMQWIVDISLFDETFWNMAGFGFPKSPGDGGLLSWLGSRKLNQASFDSDSPPEYHLETGANGEERLRAECLCGGVSLTIPRPSDAMKQDKHIGRFVAPGKSRKWKAFLDFGQEIRSLTSAHFMPWVVIPRVVLEPKVPPNLAIGTIKTYQVSDKITKGFCGRCGATVFLRHGDGRGSGCNESEVLNIAMGILRAPEGAKAENWFSWRAAEPTQAEDPTNFDVEFMGAVIEGQRKWLLEKYGELPDFDIL
ncbi:DUF636 domain protein [Hypomontagnella submonticulosa]|nr:DUF636 domain protein [Hypomontagnella submonticulosa]